MPYLIDGHNLIGQLPDISLSDPNDEAKLVIKLVGFAARKRSKCVVVFDKGITAGKSRMSNSAVEVVFAPSSSSADAIMIARIESTPDPGYWTVVSNDNAVLKRARQRQMKAIKSSVFARELRPVQVIDKDADPGEAEHVRISPAEVEMWIQIFKERRSG
jgi:predicted RNA-binding protein with PIN domain